MVGRRETESTCAPATRHRIQANTNPVKMRWIIRMESPGHAECDHEADGFGVEDGFDEEPESLAAEDLYPELR